jgi:hypothetical protein
VSSPARNRVTPLGEIVALPQRGAFTGNRGHLHHGREIVRFHAGDLWIICALRFNDRWNEQWLPNRFTWLYFHDEAVAFAAGHRPCGECRHGAYVAYRDAWAETHGGVRPSAKAMNRRLHAERLYRGTHRRRLSTDRWTNLPDGAFVFHEDRPHLVFGTELLVWTRDGYGRPVARPSRGEATVITPPSSVEVLRAGYPVVIDPSV